MAASFHGAGGGPRERCALDAARAIRTRGASGSSLVNRACRTIIADAVGGTAAGTEVTQPMQQSTQILPLLSSDAGAGRSAALLWQITGSGCVAASAAAWAAPKLAIRLASAIA